MPLTEIECLKLIFFVLSTNKSNLDKIQKIQYHIFKCPDEHLILKKKKKKKKKERKKENIQP